MTQVFAPLAPLVRYVPFVPADLGIDVVLGLDIVIGNVAEYDDEAESSLIPFNDIG
jgi:hypothetical protein